VVAPTVFGPLVLLLRNVGNSCEIGAADYLSTAGFVVTGALSAVAAFFRFGPRSGQHFTYAAKYADVMSDITAETVKKKRFRVNADVFITELKVKLDHLKAGEPKLPAWLDAEADAF
jgi:hypothetical protein